MIRPVSPQVSIAPRVSVIVPCHNGARSVATAIDSIRRQTMRDLEILAIDDGSSDDTPKIIRQLAAEDSRIITWSQPASGTPAAARNAALAHARGDMIAFLDDDDLYHPSKLERQLSVFARCPELDLVFHDHVRFYTDPVGPDAIRWLRHVDYLNLAREHLKPLDSGVYLAGPGFYTFSSLEFVGMHISTVMLRRSFLEQEPHMFRQDMTNGEDLDLWLRLIFRGQIAYLDEVLSYYRLTGAGVSSNLGERSRAAAVVHTDNLRRGSAQFSQADIARYRRKIAEALFNLGYWNFATGCPSAARKAYRAALKLAPSLSTIISYTKTFVPRRIVYLYRRLQGRQEAPELDTSFTPNRHA